jgi:putative heme-binding domain-containing protein
LAAKEVRTQRAALIALDQMRGRPLTAAKVIPYLSSPETLLHETARWIVGQRPEWGEALASHYQQRLGTAGIPLQEHPSPEEKELVPQLAALARSSAIQKLLGESAQTGAPAIRHVALRAMAQAGLKEAPAEWTDALLSVLRGYSREQNDALLRQAALTLSALNIAKDRQPELATAALVVAQRSDLPAETRLEVLAAAPGRLPVLPDSTFHWVVSHLDRAQAVRVRGNAAAILARAALTVPQRDQLTKSLSSVGPLELPRLLSAFDGSTDEALGLKLVAALERSPALSSLRAEMLQPRLTNFPSSVQTAGERLLATLRVDAAAQSQKINLLLSELKDGDVRRGQALFNSAKAACSTCHAIGYLGGNLGPDLTRIGQVRTERDLLEAVVYPSASFVRSYEPVVVSTRDGEHHTGILRRDAPDELVLATGPGAEVRLDRKAVAEVQPGTLSLMPQGLDEQLTRQELADLIAFLKATRW